MQRLGAEPILTTLTSSQRGSSAWDFAPDPKWTTRPRRKLSKAEVREQAEAAFRAWRAGQTSKNNSEVSLKVRNREMSKQVMREESERLVKEALERKTLTVKQDSYRQQMPRVRRVKSRLGSSRTGSGGVHV